MKRFPGGWVQRHRCGAAGQECLPFCFPCVHCDKTKPNSQENSVQHFPQFGKEFLVFQGLGVLRLLLLPVSAPVTDRRAVVAGRQVFSYSCVGQEWSSRGSLLSPLAALQFPYSFSIDIMYKKPFPLPPPVYPLLCEAHSPDHYPALCAPLTRWDEESVRWSSEKSQTACLCHSHRYP